MGESKLLPRSGLTIETRLAYKHGLLSKIDKEDLRMEEKFASSTFAVWGTILSFNGEFSSEVKSDGAFLYSFLSLLIPSF